MSPVKDTLGRSLRDLRISVTDRCNFRCNYCMPTEIFKYDYPYLNKNQLLSFEEIERLAQLFVARCGAKKLRLTGGEPLLRTELPQLIRRLAAISQVEDLSLTTNGWRLSTMADDLRAAGLMRVSVSLDALDTAVFSRINGVGRPGEPILRGINVAIKAGLPVKINMVVMRGVNEEQILPMARYFNERGICLRFIEFMDVGNCNAWSMDKVVSSKEILEVLQKEFSIEALSPAYQGEVARKYRFRDSGTEFGLITSITQTFCGNCNRARLSADGKLFLCLFARMGHDLKKPLRQGATDEALVEFIQRTWHTRSDRYSDLRAEIPHQNTPRPRVEMSYIGG